MVFFRYPVKQPGDNSRLAEALHFKTSNVKTRNRLMKFLLFKAALSEQLCPYDVKDAKKSGIPNQAMLNLYEKWGAGGFGLVLTSNIMVQHQHLEAAHNAIISKEGDVPERSESFRRLAVNCKKGGALAIAQLSHAGRQTPFVVNPTPFSSSSIQLDSQMRGHSYGKPVELSREQIKTEVIERFVYAAKYAKDAGFDGVEFHAAHGYLLASFISPSANNRKDEYGGSVENRVRILREIYQAVRREIPASTNFIIGIKLNSVEFQTSGLSNEDAIEVAKAVEAEGYDFIELTGGNYEKWQMGPEQRDSTHQRESYFGSFSKTIRDNLKNTVVYVTGGFRTVPGMINALTNGDTDGFGLGRPSCAEPDIARKFVELGYQSTAINWAEYNFMIGAQKGSAEIYRLSRNSLADCAHDPCQGHMDLSIKSEFDAFVLQLAEFHQKRQKLINSGTVIPEWFEYVQHPAPVFDEGLYGTVQA
ncbi:Oxidored-FMN domain-containing protein [Aphelenchoides bicaudatus]|nr:Oxidored-FMN domain-containing protein [Aphelenchoides bicaudatus]